MLVGVVLIYHLTYSGLWYDESIEYWFSKSIKGNVPGGRWYDSMYERICSTWQPPLYNILMYLWLHLWDTEFGFRFFGVLVTLIGCIGVYATIKCVTKSDVWSAMATCLYGASYTVVYYTLECAEYYLVMCFVVWSVYFFIQSITTEKTQSLIGFYLCACLAVYSQYGAAFVIAGLYFALLLKVIKEKNIKMLRKHLLFSAVVLIFFVLPLLYFFLLPQMQVKVVTDANNHIPDINKNIIFDFFEGMYRTFEFSFQPVNMPEALGVIMGILFLSIVVITGITIHKSEEYKGYRYLYYANIVTWLGYWLAVKFKFYAYTPYGSGFGKRWGVPLTPLWFLSLIILIYIWVEVLQKKKGTLYKPAKQFIVIIYILYFAINIFGVHDGWKKDSMREITDVWYKEKLYKKETLVNQYSDANFQFYLVHDARYKETHQENIRDLGFWSRNTEGQKLYEEMNKLLGTDWSEEYYYIGPNNEHLTQIVMLFSRQGYGVETIYSEENGKSILLRFESR